MRRRRGFQPPHKARRIIRGFSPEDTHCRFSPSLDFFCAISALCAALFSAGTRNRRPRSTAASEKDTHITPDQAKQLFALVDELIQFSSQETGLPVKATSSASSPPAPPSRAT